MSIKGRFAQKYTDAGELEVVILKDNTGAFLDTRLGPYSATTPPSSGEFPDWATLKTALADSIGNGDVLEPERFQVVGPDTWATTADVKSFTVKANTVAGTTTFTDINSVITPILEGEVLGYGVGDSDINELDFPVTLTVDTGDTITVELLRQSS